MKNRIEFYRQKAGESQIELGAAVGAVQASISMYETGVHTPYIVMAQRIAAHYGVTMEEMFPTEDANGIEV